MTLHAVDRVRWPTEEACAFRPDPSRLPVTHRGHAPCGDDQDECTTVVHAP